MELRIITTVLLLAYLMIQSWMDMKTMQVWSILNNMALLVHIILYAGDCYRLACMFSLESIIVATAILLLYRFGAYGSGDAKAMVTIYIALRYWHAGYPHPDLLLFLISMFAAHTVFVMIYGTRNFARYLQRRELVKRAAFFPALTAGYAAGVVVGAACSLAM